MPVLPERLFDVEALCDTDIFKIMHTKREKRDLMIAERKKKHQAEIAVIGEKLSADTTQYIENLQIASTAANKLGVPIQALPAMDPSATFDFPSGASAKFEFKDWLGVILLGAAAVGVFFLYRALK